MSLMQRRMMMAMGMEDEEVKEWKLIKDYTVPEGEIVSTIGTPTEEEMDGISELLMLAETYAINKDGSDVSGKTSARPTLAEWRKLGFTNGRISGDMSNSIGSTTESRTIFVYVRMISGMIFGIGDNAAYSISGMCVVKHTGFFDRMPQINIDNKDVYSYAPGTNIKVYGR